MREIAQTQAGAGLPPELFAAFAEIYAEISRLPLAADDPETVDRAMSAAEVVARLKPWSREQIRGSDERSAPASVTRPFLVDPSPQEHSWDFSISTGSC